MTQQDCLRLLREVKDVAFATVDETGRPQVRMIDVMLVENGRLYFCTARGKNFYRQLITSGWTALTGMNREFQMVRLSGPVHRVAEQKKWIDRIFEENPAMKQVYPGDSRYVLEPFCIESGQMEFFDLGKSPIYRKTFSFGGAELLNVGFQITDSCIECGRCRRICPQQCI
ncbi:MAG: pyridoxamine 5'-phosphate oxidase family protein, partial [Massilioclostridium sp.]|nr:pyridoxamine 5'-phosphate oxidase family protein [Massilioclostridium sp.]